MENEQKLLSYDYLLMLIDQRIEELYLRKLQSAYLSEIVKEIDERLEK